MGIFEFISVILLCLSAIIIAYLKFRIKPCSHDWEIIKEVNVVDEDKDVLFTRYHLRCKKCGALKSQDMHS